MMKSLAIMAVLAGMANADQAKVYEVHAFAVGPRDWPSCGAASRMLNDQHEIVVRDNAVSVNGLWWKTIFRDEFDLDISFHDGNGQMTYLTMEMMIDDRNLIGRYTLYGVLDRKPGRWTFCSDRVEIRGYRL